MVFMSSVKEEAASTTFSIGVSFWQVSKHTLWPQHPQSVVQIHRAPHTLLQVPWHPEAAENVLGF